MVIEARHCLESRHATIREICIELVSLNGWEEDVEPAEEIKRVQREC